jgi:hypothetical protein
MLKGASMSATRSERQPFALPDPEVVSVSVGAPLFEIIEHRGHEYFYWVRWRANFLRFNGYFVDRHAAGRYLVRVRREAHATAVLRRLMPEMP